MVVEPGEVDSLAWAFVLAYTLLALVYVTPFVLAASLWWRSLRDRLPGFHAVPTVVAALVTPALAVGVAVLSVEAAATIWSMALFAALAGLVAGVVRFLRGRMVHGGVS